MAQSQHGQIQEGSREKRREVLVQSQVRFNRIREKGWEALVQNQVRFNRTPEKVGGRLWYRARSDSIGF